MMDPDLIFYVLLKNITIKDMQHNKKQITLQQAVEKVLKHDIPII